MQSILPLTLVCRAHTLQSQGRPLQKPTLCHIAASDSRTTESSYYIH